MNRKLLRAGIRAFATAVFVLAFVFVITSRSSYADPQAPSVSTLEPDGTLHAAPGYRPAEVGPEYRTNPSVYNPGDLYARDEVIIRFRPNVPIDQQNALLAAHGMRFGRAIYGDRAFVAKVPLNTAMTLRNALRGNPLLETVGLNTVMEYIYDPNDPYAQRPNPAQANLERIDTYVGWDFSHALGAVSLVAIIDSGIDAGGSDGLIHPEFASKFRDENWQTFAPGTDRYSDDLWHGTWVAGLATAGTHNTLGIAAVGFNAWPMALKVGDAFNFTMVDRAISAVNWAADHGASVINMSFACRRIMDEACSPNDGGIQALKKAIDTAFARGITVVAGAGNWGRTYPGYPAAFGQLHIDDYWWPYNEKLVIAASGTVGDSRHNDSAYGIWIDFGAPMQQDDGQSILSTNRTENSWDPYYTRNQGTSIAAPQEAGLAALLTSMGYSSDKVWEFIKEGATDLGPPGYDEETGWGRIDVGASTGLAWRNPVLQSPGMAVVPNTGKRATQWFNFMGSGFYPGIGVRFEWSPPCPVPPCPAPQVANQIADNQGLAGYGIQPKAGDPTGNWTVRMCEQILLQDFCTQTLTFTVE